MDPKNMTEMDSEKLLKQIAETVRRENEDFAERQAAEKMRRTIMLDLYDREVEARAQQKKLQKPVPTFKDFFVKEYRDTLPQALKEAFSDDSTTITTLSILIHTLRHEYEPALLHVVSGKMKAFHSAMEVYFRPKDIGARTNYKNDTFKNRNSYSKDILICKDKINLILKVIDN